ncbi:Origin of replication complex subunit 6 [Mitosporidium daphniae]
MDLIRNFDGYFSKVLRSSGLNTSEYGEYLEKSRSLFKRSLILCPSMGPLEPARVFVCIELVLAQSKITIDRAFNVRFSCLTNAEYLTAMQQLSSGLSLNLSKLSIRVLGLSTGCEQLICPCEKLLDMFIPLFCSTLPEASKAFVTNENPDLLLAIFIAVTSCLKLRVDKKLIIEKYSINERSFQNYLQSIRHMCRKQLDAIQADSLLFKELKKQKRSPHKTIGGHKDVLLEMSDTCSPSAGAENCALNMPRRSVPLLPEHIKYAGILEDSPEFYFYKRWRDSILLKYK